MNALAKTIFGTIESNVDVDVLKTVALFCGIGLTASLIMALCGLDLSKAFF